MITMYGLKEMKNSEVLEKFKKVRNGVDKCKVYIADGDYFPPRRTTFYIKSLSEEIKFPPEGIWLYGKRDGEDNCLYTTHVYNVWLEMLKDNTLFAFYQPYTDENETLCQIGFSLNVRYTKKFYELENLQKWLIGLFGKKIKIVDPPNQ